MSKRSTLHNPRWHNKNDKEPLHPMTIKFWITKKMMVAFAYYNLRMDYNTGNYSLEIVPDKKATPKQFEERLRQHIRWHGEDWFDSQIEEMEDDHDKRTEAERYVEKMFPKWFKGKNNARNFMMEDA